jgi:hypothetical protein
MTEILKRFNDEDKWFIDGLTNQMCGYYSDENFDCEPENIPFQTLIKIMELYVQICEDNIFFRLDVENRWEYVKDKDGIFQDLYDDIFEEYNDFFIELSQEYPLPS